MIGATSNTMEQATTVAGAERPKTVLVVGSPAFAQRVQRLLSDAGVNEKAQAVPDYLTALGELPEFKPSLLIGDASELDDPVEPTARALRQLAPQARLMLLSPESHQAHAVRAVVAGFDEYLLEPVDGDRFSQALTPRSTREPALDGHPELAPQTPPADPPEDQDQDRPIDAIDMEPPASDRLAADPTTAARLETNHPLDPGLVAGVELIDKILHSRQELRDAALKQAAAYSGLAGIQWAPSINGVPRGHTHTPIGEDHADLGVLHAPQPAPPDQLQTLAHWMGRWMTLDQHVNQLWRLAMQDELTELWNRRYFNRFLEDVLKRAAQKRFHVSLLLFDIDDFKYYNDRYGHSAGDQILRETAHLMRSLVREHDVVARIGGDEFAVIFWDAAGPRRPNSTHPHDPIQVAQRFRKAIAAHRFPKLGHQAHGTLTISGGLAGYPWDGHTPQALIDHADKMAMQSKNQGKNAIAFGPGAVKNSNAGSA